MDAMRVRYLTAATPAVAKAIGKVVSIATAKPRVGKGQRERRVAVGFGEAHRKPVRR